MDDRLFLKMENVNRKFFCSSKDYKSAWPSYNDGGDDNGGGGGDGGAHATNVEKS